MAQQLRGDWKSTRCQATGQTFYFSLIHDARQWQRPIYSQPPPPPRAPQDFAVDPTYNVPGAAGAGLPGDWKSTRYDVRGDGNYRVGYFSYDLGVAQWERPTRPDAPPLIKLPDGWRREKMESPDNRVYYVSDDDDRRQWELPTTPDLPPLPRQGPQGFGYQAPPLGPPPVMSEPDLAPPGDWKSTHYLVNGRRYLGWFSLESNSSQWPRPRFADSPPPSRDIQPPDEDEDPDPAPPPPPGNDPGHDPDEDPDERAAASEICCQDVARITALHEWDDEDSVDQLYAKVDPKQRKGRRKAWISTAHALAIMERTDDPDYSFEGSFRKFLLVNYGITIPPANRGSDRPSGGTGRNGWNIEAKLHDLTDMELEGYGEPSGWHEVLQLSCESGISHVILWDPPRVAGKEGPWGMVADSKLLRYTQAGAIVVENRVRDAIELVTQDSRHHNWNEFARYAHRRKNTAATASYALSVFKSVILGGDERWPGAHLLCTGCLCSNQKQSVNAYTFTYYCFALASHKNIEVKPNRFKGSRICFEQVQAELSDEELRPKILSMLHDTIRAEWTSSDEKVLKDIIASTMKHAEYVVEDSDTLFEGSETLLQLRDNVLRENETRAEACLPRVKAAWRHFAGKEGIELDGELEDVVERSSTGPGYRVFLWRKDDGEKAKRYFSLSAALDRADAHEDELTEEKLDCLLKKNTHKVRRWKGKDEWERTTQWAATDDESKVPANKRPCVDG